MSHVFYLTNYLILHCIACIFVIKISCKPPIALIVILQCISPNCSILNLYSVPLRWGRMYNKSGFINSPPPPPPSGRRPQNVTQQEGIKPTPQLSLEFKRKWPLAISGNIWGGGGGGRGGQICLIATFISPTKCKGIGKCSKQFLHCAACPPLSQLCRATGIFFLHGTGLTKLPLKACKLSWVTGISICYKSHQNTLNTCQPPISNRMA